MKRPLVIFAAAIILVAGLYEYSLHASPIAANPLASVAQVILSVVVVDTGSNSGNNNSSPTPSSPPAGAGAAGAPPAPQSQVIEPKPNDISDAKIDVNGDGKIDLA
ncbi:MAG: hypothetical protein JO019_00855, partial [Candidatus Kaiserbacteria bacterium]|nr:hypothetical protein [Candidatus Kaiserbacteria bacterium]